MRKKAIIISIKGYYLSIKEQVLITNEKPWGLILFKRNIKSLTQVKNLIKKIRKCSKDPKLPILIDEEGKMLREKDLQNFAKLHKLTLISIKEIIEFIEN